jgi:hypothetical protein
MLYKAPIPDLNAAVSAALGLDHDPRAYPWQDDDDLCERLVERLSERGITVRPNGSTVELWRRRERLASGTDSNRRRALCLAVVKLADRWPGLLAA